MKKITMKKNHGNHVNLMKIMVQTLLLLFAPLVMRAQFSGGAGTEASPYQITTAAQLAQLATYVNGGTVGYNNKWYLLMNDIDLSDYQSGAGWTPIGPSSSLPFRGVFNGGNHKITGLKINITTSTGTTNTGLFGYVSNGKIRNLGVEGIANVDNSVSSSVYLGLLAGLTTTNTEIANCYATGTITNNVGNAGLLVGYLSTSGTVSNCYTTGTVTSIAGSAGGVSGSNTGCTISNCYSTAMVTGATRAAGIMGAMSNNSLISNCAALNPQLIRNGTTTFFGGRIAGSKAAASVLNANIAFEEMISYDGTTNWSNIGADNLDGENIFKARINSDPTLGGRFTAANGWTTAPGSLPGLFGNTVEMPEHLKMPPSITTTTLPTGTTGTAYSTQLEATGTPSITWTLESGSLPTGLTLSTEGIITGTPTVANTFNFTVKAANSAGYDVEALSITVTNSVVAPIITTTTLPDATRGALYSAQLEASGTAPIAWTLESGSLPTGLALSTEGIITGTPTVEGVFNFTVKAANSAGNDTKALSIAVVVAPIITTATLPSGVIGIAYSQQLTATGTAPVWTLESGSLPTGLTLSATGLISGTPTVVNTFNFTVKAANSAGNDFKALSITVHNSAPAITTTTLPNGAAGTAYSVQLEATGITPLTWTLESGSLPTGLTLSTAGTITGTPTAEGTFNFTVKAANSAGNDIKALSINILFVGAGTTTNPYQITTATQLARLAQLVNSGNTDYYNKYYILMNDISLSEYQAGEGWMPIGTSGTNAFRGNFNGNNHKITELKITATGATPYTGLFGYTSYGSVINLGIEGVIDLNCNDSRAGLLAGQFGNGSISNCYATGTITTSETSSAITGLLVGFAFSVPISNCYTTGTVTNNSWSISAYAGGMVGFLHGTSTSHGVLNCYSTATVSGVAAVGGIAGNLGSSGTTFTSRISNCAALNPRLNSVESYYEDFVCGRVVGIVVGNNSTLSANIAFEEMINYDGTTNWTHIGATNLDGANISKLQINTDGTLGGRFTAANGWTTAPGRLPGLFGNTVEMPEHLKISPSITTTTLPDGIAGIAYSAQLTATGVTPITWTLESGNLPTGLTLSTEGVISGTPTVGANTFNFTVKATNSWGNDTKALSIDIPFLGTGTENSPYQITTAAQLATLAGLVNAGNTNFNDKWYILMNDISLSEYQTGSGWTPIGNSETYPFSGVFDGGNHKITGLKINITANTSYIGLFGNVSNNGKIMNLGIEDGIIIIGNTVTGNRFMGLLVGQLINSANISNCYATGSITDNNNSTSGACIAGLLVGYMGSSGGCTVSNCYTAGTVTSMSTNTSTRAGGVAGLCLGTSTVNSLSNCYSTATISGTRYVGGIAGHVGNQTAHLGLISNCAALNPQINYIGTPANLYCGRIVGLKGASATLSNNIAFEGMINPNGTTNWTNIGADNLDGANISKVLINTDGTLGGRFTAANGWTTAPGSLPGLFGNTVEMPAHLILIPPSITTTTLPDGTIGTAYSAQLEATGEALTWTLESGTLPTGLTLSAAGLISGTPTEVNTFSFTVKATNIVNSDTKALSITIAAVAPIITTTTLPNGTIGTAYNQQLAATGTAPITWSLSSGSLPTGLTLSAEGVISGTPTEVNTFSFTVKATNIVNSDTKALSITIAAVAPIITTTTLPNGTIGTAYNQQLAATGTAPITWSLEGSLPTGLTLSAEGFISGTPTVAGTFNFSVQATNSGGSDTQALSITIENTGVEELRMENGEWRIYPNPTTGELRIENGELRMNNVEIYDIYGKTVGANLRVRPSDIGATIDVSHLPAGVYFVKITTETGEVIKKVIKQ